MTDFTVRPAPANGNLPWEVASTAVNVMCAKPIAKSAAGPLVSDPLAETVTNPALEKKSTAPLAHSQNGLTAKQPTGASTLAVHAGEDREKTCHSITDPIFVASTYTFADTQAVIRYIEDKQPREEYGRYGNPSERVLERKLAELEGGEAALLFTTGMSALVVLLLTKLNSGDEVIFFDECYHRSREFCKQHLSRFGVVTRQVKACDYEAMEAAINPLTKLLISESPTNPHLSIVDLERFADIGRRHHVETLIDATLGTPYNIHPLAAGIDYVLHSATKYLGGHNDLLAGTLIGSTEKLEPVRKLRGITGAINSPHNIYLLERGLKTFELRMQRHNENGQALAEFLVSHPRVEKVYYPGLPSHPYHEVAKRTMRGYGGLVTFLSARRRLATNRPRSRQRAHSAHRSEPWWRRIADRATADHELLRMLAGTATPIRDSG